MKQMLLGIAASVTALMAMRGIGPDELAAKASVPVGVVHSLMTATSGDLTLNNLATLLSHLDAVPLVTVRQQTAGQGG